MILPQVLLKAELEAVCLAKVQGISKKELLRGSISLQKLTFLEYLVHLFFEGYFKSCQITITLSKYGYCALPG